MPFSYNPHQHSKIWLSQDTATFLNRENRKRLLTMQYNQPSDDFFWAYDSRLLNEDACKELREFCQKHQISLQNVADIIPINDNEAALLQLYQLEIDHIASGGNLAAASDILRWMHAIYTLGTYSDFDVYVNTRGLPKTISVQSPILFNLSTLDATYLYSNDVIAVVDPENAKDIISHIQKSIVANYNNPDVFKNLDTRTISNNILHRLRKEGRSIPEVRHYIQENYADNQVYCVLNGKTVQQIAQEVREKGLSWGNSLSALFSQECASIKTIAQINDDELLVTKLREQERFLLLRSTVLNISGPDLLTPFLQNSPEWMALDRNGIKIEPLINKHLGSRLPAFFFQKNQPKNDLSWLIEGQQVAKLKAEKINIKAEKLRQTLPQKLIALKQRIEQLLEDMETPQPNNQYFSCFFIGQQSQPLKEIHQLQEILKCFHAEDSFDIKTFRELCHAFGPIQQTSKKIQSLMLQLDSLCRKAIIYELGHEQLDLRCSGDQENSLLLPPLNN